MGRAENLARLHTIVVGLAPRALMDVATVGQPGSPTTIGHDGPGVWIVPGPGCESAFETRATGRPFIALRSHRDGTASVALQVEGHRALSRLARLADEDMGTRRQRFLDAAARFDAAFKTQPYVLRRGPAGRPHERPRPARAVITAELGPATLARVLRASMTEPPGRGAVAGLHLAMGPVDLDDALRAQRAVRRLVNLWVSVWELPDPPGPVPRKRELAARFARLYPRSLLAIRDRLDPDARARLRVALRDLDADYRRAGGPRPPLLDQALDRLGLVEVR